MDNSGGLKFITIRKFCNTKVQLVAINKWTCLPSCCDTRLKTMQIGNQEIITHFLFDRNVLGYALNSSRTL